MESATPKRDLSMSENAASEPIAPCISSRRILSLAEAELSRIVLDIHDGPVQYLFTALSLLAGLQQELAAQLPDSDLSPRLARVATLLESSLYEIKFFLGTFRPPEFRSRSFAAIVEGLVIQHEEWTGNMVELSIENVPDELNLCLKIALYRVLQEALSNANRHSGAGRHRVRVWGEPDCICLEVIDDGRGFDPPDLDEDEDDGDRVDHIGLRGMRDRVELVGGSFQVFSKPGAGTRISVTAPIQTIVN